MGLPGPKIAKLALQNAHLGYPRGWNIFVIEHRGFPGNPSPKSKRLAKCELYYINVPHELFLRATLNCVSCQGLQRTCLYRSFINCFHKDLSCFYKHMFFKVPDGKYSLGTNFCFSKAAHTRSLHACTCICIVLHHDTKNPPTDLDK